MSADKLVYMANQVGKFFAPQGDEAVVSGVAEHLERFWDPRMRALIGAHLDAGGAGLDEAVRRAVALMVSRARARQGGQAI